tara:strand:- start:69521 stop:69886 length:366 start_codon:yes stop_codon:yes gene_type:complete
LNKQEKNMNFKFKEDLENNTVTVDVDIPSRKKASEERRIFKYDDVIKLLKENYSVPDTHTLGNLISNMHVKLDSFYDSNCTGSWTFQLLQKSPPVTQSKAEVKKTTKKSAAPRTKKTSVKK